jgi:hypothetical protein
MENVTIGQIVAVIGIISTIAGFFVAIYKFIKKVVLDKIEKNKADIKILQGKVDMIENEIKDGKEERLILLKGQLACLKGLKEQGCNGPVTKAIADIEQYILTKSHE